ncbi:NAD(P)-binding domain-containing protein [Corallococcus sp. ZKHCc1 1396]|uniref:NAD(P)-binding domain-containing protein n=2 Tax=Corallococcus TaxID=83461 RepID=A0ABR9PKJ3_9BACT|nr:NAD(P)-binding domain-containing protein [Corallococcus soli]MBE4748409.1 NAD(P)-binding domain-containing protein [Corallococcus soli]MCY1034805.1 NAD(P)-binding domain-containing protein [Corallococcus sp. BB11-1]
MSLGRQESAGGRESPGTVGHPTGARSRAQALEDADMKIGIIGAGLIGGTLARRWVKLGHEVSIANSRGPDTLRELAAETGAKAVTAQEAARAGEVVVVTIPQKAVPELPKDLFANVPRDVVVIDTGNYYPVRDGSIAALEGGQVESEWVASLLGRPVIKAFNNIFFQSLLEKGTPKGTPGRIALPVAGEPPEARAKVLKLVEELGFDAIDAGSLADSWRQQPGTPVYTQDLDAAGVKKALAAAERSRLPEYRDGANTWLKNFLASQGG